MGKHHSEAKINDAQARLLGMKLQHGGLALLTPHDLSALADLLDDELSRRVDDVVAERVRASDPGISPDLRRKQEDNAHHHERTVELDVPKHEERAMRAFARESGIELESNDDDRHERGAERV